MREDQLEGLSEQSSPGNVLWLLHCLPPNDVHAKSSFCSHCTDLFELLLTRRHVSTTAKKHAQ